MTALQRPSEDLNSKCGRFNTDHWEQDDDTRRGRSRCWPKPRRTLRLGIRLALEGELRLRQRSYT